MYLKSAELTLKKANKDVEFNLAAAVTIITHSLQAQTTLLITLILTIITVTRINQASKSHNNTHQLLINIHLNLKLHFHKLNKPPTKLTPCMTTHLRNTRSAVKNTADRPEENHKNSIKSVRILLIK